jgi:hypothetical protein
MRRRLALALVLMLAAAASAGTTMARYVGYFHGYTTAAFQPPPSLTRQQQQQQQQQQQPSPQRPRTSTWPQPRTSCGRKAPHRAAGLGIKQGAPTAAPQYGDTQGAELFLDHVSIAAGANRLISDGECVVSTVLCLWRCIATQTWPATPSSYNTKAH